mmetsp:Transcript_7810/g.21087  ORF Transcript_7810/g.21087 Transcript_7810/m.21087 type:complete len:269 (+) Transcript_7810:209-1015(+)
MLRSSMILRSSVRSVLELYESAWARLRLLLHLVILGADAGFRIPASTKRSRCSVCSAGLQRPLLPRRDLLVGLLGFMAMLVIMSLVMILVGVIMLMLVAVLMFVLVSMIVRASLCFACGVVLVIMLVLMLVLVAIVMILVVMAVLVSMSMSVIVVVRASLLLGCRIVVLVVMPVVMLVMLLLGIIVLVLVIVILSAFVVAVVMRMRIGVLQRAELLLVLLNLSSQCPDVSAQRHLLFRRQPPEAILYLVWNWLHHDLCSLRFSFCCLC